MKPNACLSGWIWEPFTKSGLDATRGLDPVSFPHESTGNCRVTPVAPLSHCGGGDRRVGVAPIRVVDSSTELLNCGFNKRIFNKFPATRTFQAFEVTLLAVVYLLSFLIVNIFNGLLCLFDITSFTLVLFPWGRIAHDLFWDSLAEN